MCEQKQETGGLASSTRSLSYPSSDGVNKSNYTLPKSSSQYSPCTELDKAWLFSAFPDDWRSLPSPLEKTLQRDLGLLSNVAKVQDRDNLSSVPPLPPLVGVQFFSNDVRLVRAAAPARGGGPRQKCEQISSSSIKNAKFVIANSDPDLKSLICCTYPATFPADGRIVKAHHKSLLQRIRAKFGPISYFTAFEYQSDRSAPHFHTAISVNLASLGDVVTLKRKGRFGRRYPSFQTVSSLNVWLFEAWLDIISSHEEITYKKEVLDWVGLPQEDVDKMRIAFYECNSSTAWEIMRSDIGAKHYMVKELSGLKSYQKIVPEWYDNPGRHFLYSRDMRPGDPIQEFVLGDSETREILESILWRWLPKAGRPLNKVIWNIAADMVIELLQRGYRPLSGDLVDSLGASLSPSSLNALRKFDDLRMIEFMGGSDLYSEGTINSWFAYNEAVIKRAKLKQRILQKEAQWKREIFLTPYFVKPTKNNARLRPNVTIPAIQFELFTV